MQLKRKASALTRAVAKRMKLVSRRPRSTKNGALRGDGKTWTLEMSVPRTMSYIPVQNFTINQTYFQDSWFTTSTTNPTYTSITVSFAQVDQVSALSAVFDQYKILEVECFITPKTSADIASSRNAQYVTVLDFDDSTNLTSFASAGDYVSAVFAPQTNGTVRRFVPRVAQALYAPSAFTSFGNSSPMWIDTASSNVAHYGVKLAALPVTASQVFDLQIRMKIAFRSVR